MTINRNLILLFAVCIFVGGGIGSYKSFQLFRNQTIENDIRKSEESSQWTAQSLEQKLKQLEASVSYLDQSTIETLKRFGARYFAYAYKDKKGEWSVKWKKLGEMGKEAILAEVNNLKFDQLSTTVRNWEILEAKQLVYIAPVELAESHQLKTGFLVFGLHSSFFGSLAQDRERQTHLLTSDLRPLLGGNKISMENLNLNKTEKSFVTRITEIDDSMDVQTAYFAPTTQTWILKETNIANMSFVGSTFFTYFILSSLISILIFILVLSSKSFKSSGLNTIKDSERQAGTEEVSEEPEEEKIMILDFGEFVESIIDEEMARLKKLGIRVKTQMEDGAQVFCAPRHMSDFIKRLVGNSVLALEKEDEKEIQIQLVEQKKSYQLIYVDTRSSHYPSQEASSLLSQTEGSMEGIDGIIAYAQWFYGQRLTVAKKGFCLSVDLMKQESLAKTAVATTKDSSSEIQPLEPTLERIEITEDDADSDLLFETTALNDSSVEGHSENTPDLEIDNIETVELSDQKRTDQDLDEEAVSFDKVIEEFRLKELSFKEENDIQDMDILDVQAVSAETTDDETHDDESTNDELAHDENGLYEIKSGQLKLKIRAPKKKDTDVHS